MADEMLGRMDSVDLTTLRLTSRTKVSDFSARQDKMMQDALDFKSEHGTRGTSSKLAVPRSSQHLLARDSTTRVHSAGMQRRSVSTATPSAADAAIASVAQSAGRIGVVRGDGSIPQLAKQGSMKSPQGMLSRGPSVGRLERQASGSLNTAPITRGQSIAALDTSTDTIGALSRTSSGIPAPMTRTASGFRPPPLARGPSGLTAAVRPNRSNTDLQRLAESAGTARGTDTARGDGKPTEREVLSKRSKDYVRGRSVREIRLANVTSMRLKGLAWGLMTGPTLISDTIVVGARDDAADGTLLHKLGVTHVLNCAVQLPNPHEGSKKHRFVYLKLPLVDDENQDLSAFVQPACDFIRRAEEVRGRVLVHCIAGASRSVALVLMYFMIEYKLSLRQIFDYVKVRVCDSCDWNAVHSLTHLPLPIPVPVSWRGRRHGRKFRSMTGSRCSWRAWKLNCLGKRRWRRRIAAASGSSTRGGRCETSMRRWTSPRRRRVALRVEGTCGFFFFL